MIPKPIYEILPFIYILVGALSALNVDIVPGRFCGLLLLSAGAMIWHMRRMNRTAVLPASCATCPRRPR